MCRMCEAEQATTINKPLSGRGYPLPIWQARALVPRGFIGIERGLFAKSHCFGFYPQIDS